MSERKSWDIQPRNSPRIDTPRAVQPSFERPSQSAPTTPAREQARRERPFKERRQKVRRKPVAQSREPLKDRRRRERRRSTVLWVVLVVFSIAASIAVFWIPAFRIQNVSAAGPDADGVQRIASEVLSGRENLIFPRNSIALFPTGELRTRILNTYPEISAVSISRSSFNSISLTSIPREQALIWCGETYTSIPAPVPSNAASSTASAAPTPSCYSTDSQGVVFAPLPTDSLSSSGALWIFGALTIPSDIPTPPLGATIAQAHSLPNMLQLIKIFKSLGAPIIAAAIRGDEVDFYTQNNTKITYVLGREEMARQLAESAFPSLNLADGSLEYIDLRFDGKVYFKKAGAAVQTTTSSTVTASSTRSH